MEEVEVQRVRYVCHSDIKDVERIFFNEENCQFEETPRLLTLTIKSEALIQET